jgi:hypothetical protein
MGLKVWLSRVLPLRSPLPFRHLIFSWTLTVPRNRVSSCWLRSAVCIDGFRLFFAPVSGVACLSIGHACMTQVSTASSTVLGSISATCAVQLQAIKAHKLCKIFNFKLQSVSLEPTTLRLAVKRASSPTISYTHEFSASKPLCGFYTLSR